MDIVTIADTNTYVLRSEKKVESIRDQYIACSLTIVSLRGEIASMRRQLEDAQKTIIALQKQLSSLGASPTEN
jgi:chromosome segregation ATPase